MTIYTSPTCGKCHILKKKLDQKGIEYEECQDIDKMQTIGILNIPVLEVNGELLPFEKAIKFVNER